MRYCWLYLLGILFSSCAGTAKKYTAPADIPKPTINISADKINNHIISISKTISTANLRAEKIKQLLEVPDDTRK